jgi:uncharacterized protein (TIGR00730 family)
MNKKIKIYNTNESMKHIGIFSGSKSTHFFDDISIELKEIAEGISKEQFCIVYGGGTSGLMGVIPRRFSELGGKVTGIDADMFVKKFGKADFGDLEVYDTFSERQSQLIKRSDIVLVLPGGVGTISELFDVLTLNDLNIKKTKVIIYNYNGFYDEIIQFIHKRQQEGFIKPLDNIRYVRSADEVLDILKKNIE